MTLLDTDICSFAIRGTLPNLNRRIMDFNGELCVSAITAAELRYGASKKNSQKLRQAVERFLSLVQIVPWTAAAASVYAEIRTHLEQNGTPIGNMDLLIASAARAEGAFLVTHNTAHFSRVPGLFIEDWTV